MTTERLPEPLQRILDEVLDNLDADLDVTRAILEETSRDIAFLRDQIDGLGR